MFKWVWVPRTPVLVSIAAVVVGVWALHITTSKVCVIVMNPGRDDTHLSERLDPSDPNR